VALAEPKAATPITPAEPPLAPLLTYPADAWGITPPAQPAVLLVRNATVWTQGPAGKLARADVLVRAGKIAAVGPDLALPAQAVVIDGLGKHVTPGLIDAHVHIAARGDIINPGAICNSMRWSKCWKARAWCTSIPAAPTRS